MDLKKLRAAVDGLVVTDPETLEEVSMDFGRLFYQRPAVVVAPDSEEDVRRVIDQANEEGFSVSARGSSQSQGGQSLSPGGVLLDMLSLNRPGEMDGGTIWAGAGMTWGDLTGRVMERGWMPPVLTNGLNVTVGGTLSVGGLGVSSHRFGPQIANVAELEVVTGTGDLVRCSQEENSELFRAVLGGVGQFGVITRARIKLRRFKPRVRTFFLLYSGLRRLRADLERVVREGRADYLEAWCSPCLQGFREFGGARVPFAEWFYPLQISVEYDENPPGDSLLRGLSYDRKVHQEDLDVAAFIRRMEPVFQLWRESGNWTLRHPWMECFLPWKEAPVFIEGVLKSFPPHLLQGGQILLWAVQSPRDSLPMLVAPEEELILAFGILPSVPKHQLEMTVSLLDKATELLDQVGGKRYLSGYLNYGHQEWRRHFDATWSPLLQWKEFFDPNGVMNPGFILYRET